MQPPHLDKMMVVEEMGDKENEEEGDVYKSEPWKKKKTKGIAEINNLWKKKKGGIVGIKMLFPH